MEVIAIWAEDLKKGIGYQNSLPWSNRTDLKHFKETTTGHPVVMGYSTYESLGSNPLPHRLNVVMSSKHMIISNGGSNVLLMKSPQAIVEKLPYLYDKIYIIGGKQTFEAFKPFVTRVIVSTIQNTYDTDVKMPTDFLDNFTMTRCYPLVDKVDQNDDDVIVTEYMRTSNEAE